MAGSSWIRATRFPTGRALEEARSRLEDGRVGGMGRWVCCSDLAGVARRARLFRSGLGVGVLRVALVRDPALFGGRR